MNIAQQFAIDISTGHDGFETHHFFGILFHFLFYSFFFFFFF